MLNISTLVLEGLAIDHPVGTRVTNLTRLSGGANNETWRFTWHETPLILRRRPFSAESVENLDGNILGLSLVDEAHIIQLAAQTGVPVPHIYTVLETSHPLGESFVMAFIRGESIPQQWLNARRVQLSPQGLSLRMWCGTRTDSYRGLFKTTAVDKALDAGASVRWHTTTAADLRRRLPCHAIRAELAD